MALPAFCPVPVDLPVDPAGIDLTIGSGPYRLATRSASREIVLRPNPYYRGPRPRRFASIVVTIGGTIESLYRTTESNGADLVWDNIGGNNVVATDAVRRYGVGKARLFRGHLRGGHAVLYADFPDPANIIDVFFGDGSGNVSHFDVPQFERRIRRAGRRAGTGRYRAYSEIERDILRTQAPAVPLYISSGLSFVGPRVGCVSILFGDIDIERLCLHG